MDKKTTQMLKGIAIVMMVFHHFWGGEFNTVPKWLFSIADNCKMCVGLYAVLAGYGYNFAKEKTISYGAKRIWGLLKIYWIMLFTLFIPIALFNGWRLTPKVLIYQMFGMQHNLNFFAWFVYFYIFAMVIMPFGVRVLRFNCILNFCIAITVPYLFEVLFHSVPNYSEIAIVYALFNCFMYLPCFLVGYLVARYKLFEKANKIIKKRWLIIVMSVIAVLGSFTARRYLSFVLGFHLDTFYVPVFIWGASNVINMCDFKIMNILLSFLGKYSTGIWFFHAVFFSTYVKDIFQPILKMVKQPGLMFIWMIVLSLLGAYVYQKVLQGLQLVFKRIGDG